MTIDNGRFRKISFKKDKQKKKPRASKELGISQNSNKINTTLILSGEMVASDVSPQRLSAPCCPLLPLRGPHRISPDPGGLPVGGSPLPSTLCTMGLFF